MWFVNVAAARSRTLRRMTIIYAVTQGAKPKETDERYDSAEEAVARAEELGSSGTATFVYRLSDVSSAGALIFDSSSVEQ